MNIKDKSGWLFPNPEMNEKHTFTDEEIEQLFQLSKQEEVWVNNVKSEVEHYDKNPPAGGGEFIANMSRVMNTGGTIISYPYGLDIITFPSRRHFFRGELGIHDNCVPSLNRKLKGKSEKEKLLLRAVADMRINQFADFIWKLHIIPYWEAKLSDVNYIALGQHYGFDTNLLDLTNDVMTALFFATCVYDKDTNKYRPLTKEECDQKEYGVIFHTPNWKIDINNVNIEISDKIMKYIHDNPNQPINIESGALDGIAFQIGMQPLMRCHHQSGYILPMIKDKPLEDNWEFEKLYIKLTPELSEKIFNMMDKGNKVFPNEGIDEALPILYKIKIVWSFLKMI